MDYELIDTLKQVLESKIEKTRSDIRHELHNKSYNDSLQNEIGILEWVLEYIVQKKVHIDRLEVIVQDKIAELKITMNKATHREVTDFLFTKIETLRWVLYVIHSINKGCPAERRIVLEDSLPTRKFYD
jgi:acetolactate synthase small subunit